MAHPFDVRWTDVWIGLAVAVVATAALAPAVLRLDENVWWVAVVAILSIGVGATVAGMRAGQIEPLNGVLLMAVFFVGETTILLVGEAMEWLPEPLPGLPVGDSTFFFVTPLGQLLFAVAGSLLGGWWATRGPATRPDSGTTADTSQDDSHREA